jgi:hypothetical protein
MENDMLNINSDKEEKELADIEDELADIKAGDQRILEHPQLSVPPIPIQEKHPIQVGQDKLTTAMHH